MSEVADLVDDPDLDLRTVRQDAVPDRVDELPLFPAEAHPLPVAAALPPVDAGEVILDGEPERAVHEARRPEHGGHSVRPNLEGAELLDLGANHATALVGHPRAIHLTVLVDAAQHHGLSRSFPRFGDRHRDLVGRPRQPRFRHHRKRAGRIVHQRNGRIPVQGARGQFDAHAAFGQPVPTPVVEQEGLYRVGGQAEAVADELYLCRGHVARQIHHHDPELGRVPRRQLQRGHVARLLVDVQPVAGQPVQPVDAAPPVLPGGNVDVSRDVLVGGEIQRVHPVTVDEAVVEEDVDAVGAVGKRLSVEPVERLHTEVEWPRHLDRLP